MKVIRFQKGENIKSLPLRGEAFLFNFCLLHRLLFFLKKRIGARKANVLGFAHTVDEGNCGDGVRRGRVGDFAFLDEAGKSFYLPLGVNFSYTHQKADTRRI